MKQLLNGKDIKKGTRAMMGGDRRVKEFLTWKCRVGIVAGAVAVMILATGAFDSPALGASNDEEPSSSTAALEAIENVADSAATPETHALSDSVALADSDEGFGFEAETGSTVVITDEEEPQVVLDSTHGELTVDLGGVEPPALTGSDLTILGETGQTIVPVVHDDGSVQVVTVIDSGASPTTYEFAMDAGIGSSVQLLADGGAMILNTNGEFVGGVAPAWAFDANGKPVPTWYEVEGTTLTQIVDHSSADYAYPIVADPWLWQNLFSWVTVDSYGGQPRVNLKPSSWGVYVWSGAAGSLACRDAAPLGSPQAKRFSTRPVGAKHGTGTRPSATH